MAALFAEHRFERRRAPRRRQAGVRYSLDATRWPTSDSNLVGFAHVLEGCRQARRAAPGLRQLVERLRRQPQAAL
jgi:hypothetical protein